MATTILIKYKVLTDIIVNCYCRILIQNIFFMGGGMPLNPLSQKYAANWALVAFSGAATHFEVQ
jgi:hypothetical protein